MGKCRPLADSEIEAMKSYTPALRDKAILIALEKTGYRANEIASLKTDDVFDFSSQTLKPRVQVKREHMKKKQGRRSIPLHPDLRTALTLWLAKLQQHGYLRPGMPLWLSRKHVARLMELCRETSGALSGPQPSGQASTLSGWAAIPTGRASRSNVGISPARISWR
jgi:integrase